MPFAISKSASARGPSGTASCASSVSMPASTASCSSGTASTSLITHIPSAWRRHTRQRQTMTYRHLSRSRENIYPSHPVATATTLHSCYSMTTARRPCHKSIHICSVLGTCLQLSMLT
jgi:hypothetical protein